MKTLLKDFLLYIPIDNPNLLSNSFALALVNDLVKDRMTKLSPNHGFYEMI